MVGARSVLLGAAAELRPHEREHAVGDPARLEVALEREQARRRDAEVLGQLLGLVGVRVPGARRGQRRAADRQPGGEHRRQPGEPPREAVLGRRVRGLRDVGRLAVAAERRQRLAHAARERRGARRLRHGGVARAGQRAADARRTRGSRGRRAGPTSRAPRSRSPPARRRRRPARAWWPATGRGCRPSRRPGAGCRRCPRRRAAGRASPTAGRDRARRPPRSGARRSATGRGARSRPPAGPRPCPRRAAGRAAPPPGARTAAGPPRTRCRPRAARASAAGGGTPGRRPGRGSTGCRRRRRGTR